MKWHQDYPFDPHSNDDQVTALLFVDAVHAGNGPLMIAPGAAPFAVARRSVHRRGVRGSGGQFQPGRHALHGPRRRGVPDACTGGHASGVNASSAPRTLFIVTCAAADAVPLSPVAVPSRHAGRMVRGMDTGRIRSAALQVEAPEVPKTASFLARQAGEG